MNRFNNIIIVVSFYLNSFYSIILCSKVFSFMFVFWITFASCLKAQSDSIQFKTFYFENGQKSSEGYVIHNVPVGVWKNYYESGVLKSQGKRLNNKPDSTWLFYNEFGILTNQVFFIQGVKDSLEIKFSNDGFMMSQEYYKQGKKEGFSYYYTDRFLSKKAFYKEDKMSGYAYEYNKKGDITSILNYNNGFIKTRDPINRLNSEGKKEGKWVEFYDCPNPCNQFFKIKREGRYINGLKNGYFKEYELNGDVISTLLYRDDVLVEDVNTEQIEVKTEYFKSAKVKSLKGYKRGVLEGNSVEFDSLGHMVSAEVYKNGILASKGGIFDSLGLRDGAWKDFYPDGSLKSEGTYKHGLKYGNWLFYHENGQKSQTGAYGDQELPKGQWIWYYENGQLKRQENFLNGLEEGQLVEYNDTNLLINQGAFVEGLKDGPWLHISGDYREEGEYALGERTGEWTEYYISTGNISFKGSYSDGIPIDKHTWYYPNGVHMLEGKYEAGVRTGDWKRFNEQALEILTITYEDGNEIRINGVKVKPKSVDDFNIDEFKIMDKVH